MGGAAETDGGLSARAAVGQQLGSLELGDHLRTGQVQAPDRLGLRGGAQQGQGTGGRHTQGNSHGMVLLSEYLSWSMVSGCVSWG